jgi:hypothetical protein
MQRKIFTGALRRWDVRELGTGEFRLEEWERGRGSDKVVGMWKREMRRSGREEELRE